jgi:SAM-dependent methyltransferase
LNYGSANVLHAVRYEATPAGSFKRLVAELPIKHEEFSFIDFGSGKGRALLIAATFPFNVVVGVELSPDLHRVAKNNIDIFPKNELRCGRITLELGDATSFELPSDPIVCYFYNPFNAEIMNVVLERIKISLQTFPRKAVLVYYNANQAHLFDRADWLAPIPGLEPYRVWKSTLPERRREASRFKALT